MMDHPPPAHSLTHSLARSLVCKQTVFSSNRLWYALLLVPVRTLHCCAGPDPLFCSSNAASPPRFSSSLFSSRPSKTSLETPAIPDGDDVRVRSAHHHRSPTAVSLSFSFF